MHGDTYDYSKSLYVHCNQKITIICKTHGEFQQNFFHHLNGMGCRKCAFMKNAEGRTKSREDFIEEANKKHNNFYNYDKVEYINSRDKVTIYCPIHKYFQQCAHNHITGQGCPECGRENGGYNKSDYIKKANGRICTFYTIKCWNENEEFYKIDITMNDVKTRYNSVSDMSYNYEITSEIFGEAGFIWDLEKSEIKKLKEFHYLPKIKFGGHKTECFTQYKA